MTWGVSILNFGCTEIHSGYNLRTKNSSWEPIQNDIKKSKSCHNVAYRKYWQMVLGQ